MRIEVILAIALSSVMIFTFLVLPYLNPMTYHCFLQNMSLEQHNDQFYNEWCK